MKRVFENIFRSIPPREQSKITPIQMVLITFLRGFFFMLTFVGFSFFVSLIPGVTVAQVYIVTVLIVMGLGMFYLIGQFVNRAIFERNRNERP